MKKIIILIGFLVLITGCTADVNINVSSTGINEQITVTEYQSGTSTKQQIYSKYRKYLPAFADTAISDTEPDVKVNGVAYYNRNERDLGNGYAFTYYYKYSFDNYRDARSIKHGFQSSILQRDSVEKEILFTTDSAGLKFFKQYPALTSVKINVTSPYAVKESNADYVSNGVYTWVLNRNTKKSIYIVFSDPSFVDNSQHPIIKEDTEEDKKDNVDNGEDLDILTDDYDDFEEDPDNLTEIANKNPILFIVVGVLGFIVVVFVVGKMSKK